MNFDFGLATGFTDVTEEYVAFLPVEFELTWGKTEEMTSFAGFLEDILELSDLLDIGASVIIILVSGNLSIIFDIVPSSCVHILSVLSYRLSMDLPITFNSFLNFATSSTTPAFCSAIILRKKFWSFISFVSRPSTTCLVNVWIQASVKYSEANVHSLHLYRNDPIAFLK